MTSKKMTKEQIARKMIKYAVINWKYSESATEDTIEEITSQDSIEQFLNNLEEDLNNSKEDSDIIEMIAIVSSLKQA